MYRGSRKSSFSPRVAGVQQSSTVGSTLWGMASGVAVVLGVVLDLAEIAPASCQPQQAYSPPDAAWWRSVGPTGKGLACSSSNGARGDPGPPWTKCRRAH